MATSVPPSGVWTDGRGRAALIGPGSQRPCCSARRPRPLLLINCMVPFGINCFFISINTRICLLYSTARKKCIIQNKTSGIPEISGHTLRCSHKGTASVQDGEAASSSDIPGPKVPQVSLVMEGSGHIHTWGKGRLAFNMSIETLTVYTHSPWGSDITEMYTGFQKSPPQEGLAQALRMESRCFAAGIFGGSPEGPSFCSSGQHVRAPSGRVTSCGRKAWGVGG